jgi:hypothetical protein
MATCRSSYHCRQWRQMLLPRCFCMYETCKGGKNGAQAAAHGSQDIRTESGGWAGNKGGEMGVDAPGQHVLERTSCQVVGNSDALDLITIASLALDVERALSEAVQEPVCALHSQCFACKMGDGAGGGRPRRISPGW